MKTPDFQGFSWRRGRDSNPRGIAPKLISSQPRYDHFDTSAYMLTRFREVNAYSVFIRIPLRTPVVLMLMHRRKTAPLKAFRRFCFFPVKKISSQPRYDHFDTSAYMLICSYSYCNIYNSNRDIIEEKMRFVKTEKLKFFVINIKSPKFCRK